MLFRSTLNPQVLFLNCTKVIYCRALRIEPGVTPLKRLKARLNADFRIVRTKSGMNKAGQCLMVYTLKNLVNRVMIESANKDLFKPLPEDNR